MRNSTSHWEDDSYSRNSSAQYEIAMSMLAEHKFNGDEDVLDVGCGDGKITYQLAQRVPRGRVIGVDNSESMIRFAQKTHGTQNNLSFALKDVQSLGYENQFEVVVSTFCIPWVPNKQATYREIRRSLKPRGKAILLMPFRNQEASNLRKQVAGRSRWREHFVDYADPSDCLEDRQYEKYASDAGLTITSYRIEQTIVEFQNVQALTGFLGALTPNLTRLPDETKKREFMEELVKSYLERVPQTKNGMRQFTYTLAKMFAEAPSAPC